MRQERAGARDANHLIYAGALRGAEPDRRLARSDRQIDINDRMLRHLMAARAGRAALKHVTLLRHQGLWFVHVRPLKVPAREGRLEMYEQPNFTGRRKTSCAICKGQGVALHHPAPRADRRSRHGRGDGPDPAARRLCRHAARAAGRDLTILAVRRASAKRSMSISWRAPSPGVGRRGCRAQRGLSTSPTATSHLGEHLAGTADGLA